MPSLEAETGLAHHRVLDDAVVTSAGVDQAKVAPVPVLVRPVYDWEAANQRRIDAVHQPAPLAEALDHTEARIATLMLRTAEVELG